MPKLIILVITSKGPRYDIFREYWLRYMNSHPDVRTFFVWGNNTGVEPSDVDIVADTPELRGKIIHKTIYAMNYIHRTLEWQYLLRTNLSSIWHFPRLLEFVDNLPPTDVYAGKQMRPVHSPRNFISGSGMIFSRDVVEKILDHRDEIRWKDIDDIALGVLVIRKLGIQPGPTIDRVDFESRNAERKFASWIKRPSDVFHCRCKSSAEIDGEHFRQIYNLWYGLNTLA